MVAITGGATATFAYGPDGVRINKIVSATDQSFYLGGDVELNVSQAEPNGVWLQYLHADVKREGTWLVSWLAKDHLASNRVVTGVSPGNSSRFG